MDSPNPKDSGETPGDEAGQKPDPMAKDHGHQSQEEPSPGPQGPSTNKEAHLKIGELLFYKVSLLVLQLPFLKVPVGLGVGGGGHQAELGDVDHPIIILTSRYWVSYG